MPSSQSRPGSPYLSVWGDIGEGLRSQPDNELSSVSHEGGLAEEIASHHETDIEQGGICEGTFAPGSPRKGKRISYILGIPVEILNMVYKDIFDGEIARIKLPSEDIETINTNYRSLGKVCMTTHMETAEMILDILTTYVVKSPAGLQAWLTTQPIERRTSIRYLEFSSPKCWNSRIPDHGFSEQAKTIGRNPPSWFNKSKMSFQQILPKLERVRIQVEIDTGSCVAFCDLEGRRLFQREVNQALADWEAQLQSWNPKVEITVTSDSIQRAARSYDEVMQMCRNRSSDAAGESAPMPARQV